MFMKEQVEKLYISIRAACVLARRTRNEVRMLLTVEDLHAYLDDAFNHYCKTLDYPFDFIQASFRHSPIPPDFGGNILKLALSIMEMSKDDTQMNAKRIFCELSYMVASCIMMDSVRHKTKGTYLPSLQPVLYPWLCLYNETYDADLSINVRCRLTDIPEV